MGDSGLFPALFAGAAAKFAALYWLSTQRPKGLTNVGSVSGLVIYPIKSCRGINVQEAVIGQNGLEVEGVKDRHWMVVGESDSKRLITGRNEPKMLLITPSFRGDEFLYLDAPGMETIKIPKCPEFDRSKVVPTRVFASPAQGMDCGDEIADWISKYLGTRYRLLYYSGELVFRDILTFPEIGTYAAPGDTSAFQDLTPYMIASEASLEDVQKRTEKKIDMRNFRPNIIASGCPPFDEDYWDPIYIGESKFGQGLQDPRCTMTTIDPDLGEKDKKMEPLETLKSYRLKKEFKMFATSPCFGLMLLLRKASGSIKVGDQIFAVRNTTLPENKHIPATP